MDHLKVDLEFQILVLEGVVAMGGSNKDLLHPIFDKSLDVFPGEAFEQCLVARLAYTLTTAILLGTQYPKIYPCLIEDIDRGLSYLS